MTNPVHFVIVGVFYIVMSALIYLRSRSNQYDKGYSWILFSIFHGGDELLDGLNEILTFSASMHLFLEKIELISIFLSSVFLMMTLFIQLGLIPPKQQVYTGFFMQAPVIIWFLFLNERSISILIDTKMRILTTDVPVFLVFLSAMPALFLAFAYLIEATRLFNLNRKSLANLNKSGLFMLISSFVIFLFVIGEIYADVNALYLYLEIVTITIIMLSPIEINFGTNQSIQFFTIYHSTGIPIIDVRFNNKISDDLITLVTGMLGAINSFMGEELEMGDLREIKTEQGFLMFEKYEEFTYAILTLNISVNIKERFSQLNKELNQIISKEDNNIINIHSNSFENKLRAIILKELTVWT